MPTIELSKHTRAAVIASLQRYFEENMQEPIGNLPAGRLLDYFLVEVGPGIYNRAIIEAQERIQQRAADLTGELYAPEFSYWTKADSKRKMRRS